jgi:type III pantothenate kinase
MGGVICPGIGISADALFQKTARLQRVAIRKPARVIGTTTVGSLQSGLYYGYLGLVDGILERLLEEMGGGTTVVATGGLAALIGKGSKYIKHVDDLPPGRPASHLGTARRRSAEGSSEDSFRRRPAKAVLP